MYQAPDAWPPNMKHPYNNPHQKKDLLLTRKKRPNKSENVVLQWFSQPFSIMSTKGHLPNMHHGSMEWASAHQLAYSAVHKHKKPYP